MTSSISVRLKQGSPLLSGDLYQLEAALGQNSSGHGAGFGGEDIHFHFPGDRTKELSVSRSGKTLTISAGRFYRNTWSDIDLAEIPAPMKERLRSLLETHAEGPVPGELVGEDER